MLARAYFGTNDSGLKNSTEFDREERQAWIWN